MKKEIVKETVTLNLLDISSEEVHLLAQGLQELLFNRFNYLHRPYDERAKKIQELIKTLT